MPTPSAAHTKLFFKYHLYDLERFYCRVVAPLGLWRVRELEKQGVPKQLVAPLEFLFTNRLDAADRQGIARVEALRAELSRAQVSAVSVGTPLGMADGYTLAHLSSVPPQWGAFLYLCAKFFGAQNILELGSGAGISGAYLASAPSCQTLVTIEGAPTRAAIAAANLERIGPHAHVVQGMFQDVLPEVFETQARPFDLVFKDGHHAYAPTVYWVKQILPQLAPRALVILDDIHWSAEMFRAWQEIYGTFGFAFALDVGRFGVCYWHGAPTPTQFANLARHVGWFRNF